VTESDVMDEIQKRYFGDNSDGGGVQNQVSSSTPSTSLTSYSFAGLFLVTGIATVLALIVSEAVIWQKPMLIARTFSDKYLFRTPRSTNLTVHPMPDSIITTRTVAVLTSINGK